MNRLPAVMRDTALLIGSLAMAGGGAAAAADDQHGQAGGQPMNVDAMALYARGAAVVQDSRSLDLKPGRQTVQWPVAGPIQADTLWLSGPEQESDKRPGQNKDQKGGQQKRAAIRLVGFQISQRTSHASGPLAARIDSPVTLTSADGSTKQGLLAAMDGDVAYVRVGGDILRITPASSTQISWAGGVQTDDSPAAATLALDMVAAVAGPQTVTATYQMAAPSWQASYTGRFDPASSTLALQSTAVIDNSTATALDANKAWLVAGDVSRTGGNSPAPVVMMARAKSDAGSAGSPQASADVYRYPLHGGLHVPAGAIQAVSLMAPTPFKVQRVYRFQNYALTDMGALRQHADVQLIFRNTAGKPLPAGAVRIYDASQAADLMGEARIDDTPTAAPVTLGLGEAFDITGTHRIIKQSSDSKSGAQSRTVQITLFNAARTARNIQISEQLPDGATLADQTPATTGGTASQPQWQISVPSGGQQSLTYTLNMPAGQ